MTPRTLDVPELSTIQPHETLQEWRRRVKPAKRTRRLFWCSLFDHLTTRSNLMPHIYSIRKHAGIAGQFSVSARVGYPDEAPRGVEFVGSTYGGPVVMRTETVETFVDDPSRFGEFGVRWVERFFEEA